MVSAAVRQHAITWSIVDPDLWQDTVSFVHIELNVMYSETRLKLFVNKTILDYDKLELEVVKTKIFW